MKPQVKYGLLAGFAMFIVNMVMGMASAGRLGILVYMYIFLLSAGIFYAIREIRSVTGFINYGRALGIGTITSLVSGATSGIFMYIYVKFFNHALLAQKRIEEIDVLESGKVFKISAEQMDIMKANINLMVSPGVLGFAEVINGLLYGFLLSLLISAILKKQNPDTTMPDF